jgi:polysaccharide deacetylase 2 family uncharacterized protein YibQ
MVALQSIKTEDDFHAALQALVREANANGISIAGGWPVSTTATNHPAWDIEIINLEQP